MLKAVFFDLDGTLLPMNEDEFTKLYFGLLCKRVLPLGYDKDEFVKTIWNGTKVMVKNDGSKTNEEAFWNYYAEVYGKEKLKDKVHFDDFYVTDFKTTKGACGENSDAKKLIEFIKSKGLKVIIATNPIFPKDGMITRLSFLGIEESDVDYITCYENSHYAKPNPKYFEEIMSVNDLKPNEVVMFGNNEIEDFETATSAGIKTYLTGDNLILKRDEHKFEFIEFKKIAKTIENMLNY